MALHLLSHDIPTAHMQAAWQAGDQLVLLCDANRLLYQTEFLNWASTHAVHALWMLDTDAQLLNIPNNSLCGIITHHVLADLVVQASACYHWGNA